MKKKENLTSKSLGLSSGIRKLEYESHLGIIGYNLYALFSSRIDNYMLQIPEYKYLSLKEWDKKKAYLNTETQNRFSAFIKRKMVGLSEFASFMISHDEYVVSVYESYENKADEFYRVVDEILCSIEPKFSSVVEYNPLYDLKKEVENKVIEIEQLFKSLSNVKNITIFYLYVTYFIYSENLEVKKSINQTINFLNFKTDKDTEDLKNNYNTWKLDNPYLVDKVLKIVTLKK